MSPRRRNSPAKLKTKSTYPQMAFRVSGTAKARLMGLVEKVQDLLNDRRDDRTPHWNKNDVIVRALEMGLGQMLKRPPKR